MPNRLQNGFLLVATLLLATLPSAGWAADHGEPRILVLPLERAVRSDDLVLRVQVVGEAAVQNVTLWAMRDGDRVYRAFPMKRAEADRFEATLLYSPEDGAWHSYYVEGTSRSGPLFSNGSAESPFLVELDAAGSSGASDTGTNVWFVGLLLIPPLFLLVVFFVQPRRKLRDRKFWLRIVAPLSNLKGKEFQDAVVELSLRQQFHPERGTMLLTADQIRHQAALLRQTHPQELEQAWRTHQQSSREASEASPNGEERCESRSPDEELFWFHLLGSLVDQSGQPLMRALIAITGKVHTHPIQGRRVFDVATLRRELQRVQQMDPSELVAEAKSVPASAADALEREIESGIEAAFSGSSDPTP